MLWNVMESMESVLSFHNIPHIKRGKELIIRGMEVWKIFCCFLYLSVNKNKKMYTNNEIEIIVNNCNSISELYLVCSVFNYLIQFGYQKKSFQLEIITQLKFRELEKLL